MSTHKKLGTGSSMDFRPLIHTAGFSPVTTQLLIKTQNRFNGLLFRYSAISSLKPLKRFGESG